MSEPVTKDESAYAPDEGSTKDIAWWVRRLKEQEAITDRIAAERDELKRDVARYENGRIVLLAELNAAKQLAVRQGHKLRDLQRGIV